MKPIIDIVNSEIFEEYKILIDNIDLAKEALNDFDSKVIFKDDTAIRWALKYEDLGILLSSQFFIVQMYDDGMLPSEIEYEGRIITLKYVRPAFRFAALFWNHYYCFLYPFKKLVNKYFDIDEPEQTYYLSFYLKELGLLNFYLKDM